MYGHMASLRTSSKAKKHTSEAPWFLKRFTEGRFDWTLMNYVFMNARKLQTQKAYSALYTVQRQRKEKKKKKRAEKDSKNDCACVTHEKEKRAGGGRQGDTTRGMRRARIHCTRPLTFGRTTA